MEQLMFFCENLSQAAPKIAILARSGRQGRVRPF